MQAFKFGKLNTGAVIDRYTLKNEVAEIDVINFGAAITRLKIFDTDIVGGFDTIDDYISDDSHQGAVIGRVANRVGGACFEIAGRRYELPKNDGNNCLHGGVGFDRRVWSVASASDSEIVLTYRSRDGEEGFPSTLDVQVTYTLADTALIIDYKAIPNGATPIALTNHAYFNLNGLGKDVLGHTVQIFADRYTAVDGELIATGERPSVSGTPFDFNTPHTIGERIAMTGGGYDHNYLLCPTEFKMLGDKPLGLAARVSGDELTMAVYTDQPGMQFYTGNFLGGTPDFKDGIKKIKHGAFCLETQTEPNCIKHGVGFYGAGEVYTHTTVYEFSRKENKA